MWKLHFFAAVRCMTYLQASRAGRSLWLRIHSENFFERILKRSRGLCHYVIKRILFLLGRSQGAMTTRSIITPV